MTWDGDSTMTSEAAPTLIEGGSPCMQGRQKGLGILDVNLQ